MDGADKKVIRDAVREEFDQVAVTYTNGALKLTNALADSWAGVVDALDGFFLRNFAEDRPQAAEAVIDARISSAKRVQRNLDKKIRELEAQKKQLAPRSSRSKPAARR
jgi:hypothetical protein